MGQIVSIVPEPIVHDMPGVHPPVVNSLPAGSYSQYAGQKEIPGGSSLSFSSVDVYVLKRHAGNVRLRFTITFTNTHTSPASTQTETEIAYATYSVAGTIGMISKISVPAALLALFSGMAAFDTIGIGIERDGTDLLDTYAADFDVAKVDFVFTSGGALVAKMRPFVKRMRIGDLRNRVTIQRLNKTSDGQGGTSSSWVDVKSVWADVRPLSGGQLMVAQQMQSVITHRIVMRYQGDFTTFGAGDDEMHRGLRVEFSRRLYAIHAVIENGDWYELLCAESQFQQ